MRVGVVRETAPDERRVALVPDGVSRLARAGVQVVVQRGAGSAAHYLDSAYAAAGATLVDSVESATEAADVLVRVGPPTLE